LRFLYKPHFLDFRMFFLEEVLFPGII